MIFGNFRIIYNEGEGWCGSWDIEGDRLAISKIGCEFNNAQGFRYREASSILLRVFDFAKGFSIWLRVFRYSSGCSWIKLPQYISASRLS